MSRPTNPFQTSGSKNPFSSSGTSPFTRGGSSSEADFVKFYEAISKDPYGVQNPKDATKLLTYNSTPSFDP